MTTKNVKPVIDYVEALMTHSEFAHSMGSLRETAFLLMDGLEVPQSMREDVYERYKEEYWMERHWHQEPEMPEPTITPSSTPKPQWDTIPGAIKGSVRAAGSGRWLVNIETDHGIRTTYADTLKAN